MKEKNVFKSHSFAITCSRNIKSKDYIYLIISLININLIYLNINLIYLHKIVHTLFLINFTFELSILYIV